MSKVPKNSNFRAAQIVKPAVFEASKSAKIHFMSNQSGRKFLKFLHCTFPIRLSSPVENFKVLNY